MYPKLKPSRTRLVILTLVCTMVCAVAARVAFERWSAQKADVAPVVTPLSNNGKAASLPAEKHLEKQPTAFNQSPGSAVEETKALAGIPDLTEPARATATAGGNAPERELEARGEEEAEEHEARGDRPDEAAKFRSLQLQDEHGVIPADGLQKHESR